MALRKILKQVGKPFSRKLLFVANIIRIISIKIFLIEIII